MAASSKDAKVKEREAKEERAAKAKAKAKEKAAKDTARAARAKEKEREAKAKEKERAARAKEKERAAKAKAKEKEREAKAKEKARAAREKEQERAAKATEKEQARQRMTRAAGSAPPTTSGATRTGSRRTGTADVPADPPGSPQRSPGGSNTTIHPAGEIATRLGKAHAVTRSTKRPTVAASFTTTDHDIVREWARSRGGHPASVEGTESGGQAVGVLRIEFPEGPTEDDRLDEVDWAPFFSKFDSAHVALLYQEKTSKGETSRFHKFVAAE